VTKPPRDTLKKVYASPEMKVFGTLKDLTLADKLGSKGDGSLPKTRP
jgi:hypothetical protein